jgi:hypothetical protein
LVQTNRGFVDQTGLEFRIRLFPKKYADQFNEFWKWKMKIEHDSDDVLSESRREETYRKLKPILSSWQAYRGRRNPDCWRTLKESLGNISRAYEDVRQYSLLEFSKIPDEPLRHIWHQLGRVKEQNAYTGNYYSVISVCKPLMLLWGQTLAFDSHVRRNLPEVFEAPRGSRWSYEEWKTAMKNLSTEMKRSPKVVKCMTEKALKSYGANSVVPYGRYLDIHYF